MMRPLPRRRGGSLFNILLNMVLCLSIFMVAALLREATSDGFLSGEVRVDQRGSVAGVKSLQDDIRTFLTESGVVEELIEKKQFRRVVEILRRTEEELPFKTFYEKFETKGVPVVITNMTVGGKWTRSDIRRICKEATVKPLTPTKRKGTQWANLQASKHPISVDAFFAELDKGTTPSPYMHDWSVQKNCPELLEEYVVPKYYSQDFLKQLEVEAEGAAGMMGATARPYGETWPSLFVGEGETGSGIHVDSGDTHFVMHMIEGKKHFRLIRNMDRVVAYEDRNGATFPTDLFKPNFTQHPLLSLVTVYEAVLGPGDILFVPGGSAHQVTNLSPVISISTNYVDSSNVDRCVTEFEHQLDFEVATALQNGRKTHSLRTSMTPSPVPWKDVMQHVRRGAANKARKRRYEST